MGSILNINRAPKSWPAWDEGRRLKPPYGTESLMLIQYGTLDDDRDGPLPMSMHMRRSIYEKCLSGEYVPEEDPGRGLLLRDRNGDAVPPLRPGFVY